MDTSNQDFELSKTSGFDLYYKLAKLKIFPIGIQFKAHFKSYTITLFLFFMLRVPEQIQQIKAQLIQNSCANSYIEFLQQCSNPL